MEKIWQIFYRGDKNDYRLRHINCGRSEAVTGLYEFDILETKYGKCIYCNAMAHEEIVFQLKLLRGR